MIQEKIIGKTFNRLKVLKETNNPERHKRFECVCNCGNIIFTSLHKLKSGHTKSCGCLKTEKFKDRVTKHGFSSTRLYHIWYDMVGRCENSNYKNYHRYGGRGISVCNEWKKFIVFRQWALSNGYSEKLTIDRLDNDGDYKPSNCRWATRKQQSKNRSNNNLITHNGITETITDAAKRYGLTTQSIKYRISKGWSIKEALEKEKTTRTPIKK